MKNPRHVLFVCFGNIDRSPTAMDVFKDMLVESGYVMWPGGADAQYDAWVLSAGVHAEHYRTQVDEELCYWATEIFALDDPVERCLLTRYKQPRNKVVNLQIPNMYRRNDTGLISILKQKLAPYVDDWLTA